MSKNKTKVCPGYNIREDTNKITNYRVHLKIYQISIFQRKKKASEIKDWLEEFQQTVNTAAGNQHLKFTAEIWTDRTNSPTPKK